jgi:hypothetical protein
LRHYIKDLLPGLEPDPERQEARVESMDGFKKLFYGRA